jgi:hypothetical protein
MEWLSQNWIWVVVAVAFFAMHFFGHGGHGGHRSNGDRDRDDGASRRPGRSGHTH